MSIQAKLPVVAFNKETINPSTDAWLSTSNSVRRALENYGCFVVKTDKIPSGLRDTMFELSKDLFRLPLETKIKNTSDLLGFGYGGNFSSMPLWEYFSIENASTLEATRNFTDLLFPSGNNAFCEATFEYMKLLSEINHCVMRMVFDSYGVEAKQCDQFMESSFDLARFMKYGVPSEDKSAIAIDHPHSDKSFLSVLDENNVKGLEMKMKNGEWVYHEPSPSTFVVIAGEPFTAWSNGRIYAPVHQVAMRKPEKEAIKYTLGIFSFIKETVEVPEKLISYDNDKCLRFRPFNHLEFLKYVITEEMKGTKCSIKSYCGVNTETG